MKKKLGRPLKFKTVKALQTAIDEYFNKGEYVSCVDNFGNEFVANFVKNLPKSELAKEYKV